METFFQVERSGVLKEYSSAGETEKALLRRVFGEKNLLKITDRIKSFKDACEALGLNQDDDLFNTGIADEVAYKKLKIIIWVLNEGWVPDWDDSNQRKWFPWFYLDKPGFRFHDTHYGWTFTIATGGSRLCFKSKELAEYAANQFLALYKQFYS